MSLRMKPTRHQFITFASQNSLTWPHCMTHNIRNNKIENHERAHSFRNRISHGLPLTVNRLVTKVTAAEDRLEPPPPLHPEAPKPVAVAIAAKLLDAIPQVTSPQELREVLQQAQTQGCLSTAHVVAGLLHLGALASKASQPSSSPSTPDVDKDTRQLGRELLQRLQAGRTTLPPSLQTLTQQALAQLQLLHPQTDSEPAEPAIDPPAISLRTRQHSSPQPPPPTAAPQFTGLTHIQVPNGGSSTGAMQPAASPGDRRMLQNGGQSAVAGAPGEAAAVPRGGGRMSVPGGPRGDQQQQPPQRQKQPQTLQHTKQTQQQQAQRHPGDKGQQSLAQSQPQSQLPLKGDVASSQQRETEQAADSMAGEPRAPTRHTAADPRAPAPPWAQDHAALLSNQPGALPPLEEALQVAWAEVESRSLQEQHGGDGGDGGVIESLTSAWETMEPVRFSGNSEGLSVGRYDAALLGAALQQHPPSAMALTAVLEVLQLMVELRLMPRYEWLRAAQHRLGEEMAAEEARGGVGAGGEAAAAAASRLADLQVVYEGAGELMQMCWEADGDGRREGGEAVTGGGGGMLGGAPGRREGVREPVSEVQQLSGGEGGGGNGVEDEVSQMRQLGDGDGEEDAGLAGAPSCDDGVQGPSASAETGSSPEGVSPDVARGSSSSHHDDNAIARSVSLAASIHDAASPDIGQQGYERVLLPTAAAADGEGAADIAAAAAAAVAVETMGSGEVTTAGSDQRQAAVSGQAMAPTEPKLSSESQGSGHNDEDEDDVHRMHDCELPPAESAADVEEELLSRLPGQHEGQHDKQEEKEAVAHTHMDVGTCQIGEVEEEEEDKEDEVPAEEEDAVTAFRRLQDELRAARGLHVPAVGSTTSGSIIGVPVTNGGDVTAAPGPLDVTAVQRVVRELTVLVTEAAAAEAISRGGGSRTPAAQSRGGAQSAAAGRGPLTAAQLASLIGAASRVQSALSPLLLGATVRLFVALAVRSNSGDCGGGKGGGGDSGGALAGTAGGGVDLILEHVLTVVRACTAAGYQPPVNLLESLAQLVFTAAPSQPDPLQAAAAAPQPSHAHPTSVERRQQRAAAPVRTLHAYTEALLQLGCRLNTKQFATWVDAVMGCPGALTPSQVVQLMAACLERGFIVHSAAAATASVSASAGTDDRNPGGSSIGGGDGSGGVDGAASLLAAAITPTSRLQRLSAAEAATVVQFAAQQGLQLRNIRTIRQGAAAAALLAHLSPPRLGQLTVGQLAALLPALHTTGALLPPPHTTNRMNGGGGDTNATNVRQRVSMDMDMDDDKNAWLTAHSVALLPYTDALQLDELLPLLQAYGSLLHRPPPLLLLGFALALEAQLGSGALPALLQALRLLLVDLDMPPNTDLATAVRDELVPRLVLAASAPPPPPVAVMVPGAAAAVAAAAGQQHYSVGLGSTSALTLPQRLLALDVLAAARVRPHPAQLAVLLEPELAGGEGRMRRDLTGDDLVRLLAHCMAFRALPSYRFLGEWLEACGTAMRAVTTADKSNSSGAGSDGSASSSGSSGEPQSSLRGLSPQALAQAGWCLAQMGVQPDRAWQEEYRAALAPVLGELDAEGLSLTAHSVLALRSRPGDDWLQALVGAAAGRMAGMDAGSATRLLHFVAAAELKVTKDWMQSFFLHTLPLLQPLSPPTPSSTSTHIATADQIALLLRALAQLGFQPPPPWLTAALECMCQQADTLTPACFPLVLSSIARLCPDVAAELGSGSMVEALVRAAHARRQQFSAWELRWLLDTLGCYYPSYQLPGDAEANLIAAVRERERLGREGGSGGDVAAGLGDMVSVEWLRWAQGGRGR